MTVATYVPLVVNDPGLFPLQPELPIMPVMVIGMCMSLLLATNGDHYRREAAASSLVRRRTKNLSAG